jgi:hypothetical protein
MTAILALNLVLAIVVVAALLRLLSWAIISSRGDTLPVTTAAQQPVRRPYGTHPHAPHPHWPDGYRVQQGTRAPVTD